MQFAAAQIKNRLIVDRQFSFQIGLAQRLFNLTVMTDQGFMMGGKQNRMTGHVFLGVIKREIGALEQGIGFACHRRISRKTKRCGKLYRTPANFEWIV